MNLSINLLASGHSSVTETKWFIVGLGHKEMFLIICDYGGDVEVVEKWHVIRYRPGMNWDNEREIFGQVNELLIEACLQDTGTTNINWNDDKLASKLYWNYINNK